MSDKIAEDLQKQQDAEELKIMKVTATKMGIQFNPSIGLPTLSKRVEAHVAKDTEASKPKPKKKAPPKFIVKSAAEVAAAVADMPDHIKRGQALKGVNRLVRVRVTCKNPTKREWQGETYTVSNAQVGTIKKFVQFDEPTHVPLMIYKHLIERKCQVFHTVTDRGGRKTRQGKLIDEHLVEVLSPLSDDDMHDLAQRQAMHGTLDSTV